MRALNPRLVYASISGYGEEGPWVSRPGQDLLAEARSGVMWLNGDENQGPVPFGLAIADMLAEAASAQGILAAHVRRGLTGEGGLVETSLLEALVDFQVEVLTTHLNDGRRLPRRSSFRSAHAYLSAPYGVSQFSVTEKPWWPDQPVRPEEPLGWIFTPTLPATLDEAGSLKKPAQPGQSRLMAIVPEAKPWPR